ncbi:MAG TPA: hypothetical protein VEC75_03635, partial [Stellaceae bacterium]|nr:hypothetical protein [Stellaceae bacterium]
TLLGSAAAFVLVRQRLFGKIAILSLILAPLVLPRLIIAVALFYLYARLGSSVRFSDWCSATPFSRFPTS